jgi:hypothetical protein
LPKASNGRFFEGHAKAAGETLASLSTPTTVDEFFVASCYAACYHMIDLFSHCRTSEADGFLTRRAEIDLFRLGPLEEERLWISEANVWAAV